MHRASVYQTLGRSTSAAAAAAVAAAGGRLTTHINCVLRPHRAQVWSSHCYLQRQTCARPKIKRVSSKAAVTSSIPPTAAVFEPHIDSAVLSAQFVVLAVTIGAAAYWWYVVVPSARRTLARDKRAGPLNEYLVELQHNQDKRVERWFYTDWLRQLGHRQQLRARSAAKQAETADTIISESADASQQKQKQMQPQAAEQPVGQKGMRSGRVSDVEDQRVQLHRPQQQQDARQPVHDQQPSFWSLDNPILATTAILGTLALLSTVERGLH